MPTINRLKESKRVNLLSYRDDSNIFRNKFTTKRGYPLQSWLNLSKNRKSIGGLD